MSTNIDFARIGQRIRDIRISKKLTQEYLAFRADVNVSHISNIERNKVKVSLPLLINICNSLDVTVDYILQNEYPEPDFSIEKELLHQIKEMQVEKQRTLLRIAMVL